MYAHKLIHLLDVPHRWKLQPAVRVRTLNISITFNHFRVTNRDKCIKLLALEIWGQKVVLDEG
jgi:hypothetical protein